MLQVVQVPGHELGHAVRLFPGAFELNQKAFLQGRRADARRIERLHEPKRGFGGLHGTRHGLRDLGGNAAEETVVVDAADDFLGGAPDFGRAVLGIQLFHEHLLQRCLLHHGVEHVFAAFLRLAVKRVFAVLPHGRPVGVAFLDALQFLVVVQSVFVEVLDRSVVLLYGQIVRSRSLFLVVGVVVLGRDQRILRQDVRERAGKLHEGRLKRLQRLEMLRRQDMGLFQTLIGALGEVLIHCIFPD